MIRFAPQPVPTSSTQSTKAKANIVTALKTAVEISVVTSAKRPEASEGPTEGEMLFAELPNVSTKPSKVRSPRKQKTKPEANYLEAGTRSPPDLIASAPTAT